MLSNNIFKISPSFSLVSMNKLSTNQKTLYSTLTNPKSVIFWNHSQASNTNQWKPTLPKAQFGLSPEKIDLIKRLREEAPKFYTRKKLQAHFHINSKVLNEIAPVIKYRNMV